MDYKSLLGKRVVIMCKNNLTFAGKFLDTMDAYNGQLLRIETDRVSGFGILVPQRFVKKILEVPVNEDKGV